MHPKVHPKPCLSEEKTIVAFQKFTITDEDSNVLKATKLAAVETQPYISAYYRPLPNIYKAVAQESCAYRCGMEKMIFKPP